MITNLISPEDISALFDNPFVIAYWPLLIGGPITFVSLAKRIYWVAIPLAALTLLGQAWNLGMID